MRNIFQTIWEYPIKDKHPLLFEILFILFIPIYLIINLPFELIRGESINEYLYNKGLIFNGK